MMPSLKPNTATAPKLEEFYHSGKFWMQPSLPMPRQKELPLNHQNNLMPFVTIDDVIQTAESLITGLKKLGEYKHPLSVRKGVIGVAVEPSRIIKAGGKTYFFDVNKTKDGKTYITITESRFKKEAGTHERVSLIIFPEHLQQFTAAVQDLAKQFKGD
jgi:hypothetical protein